MWRTAIVIGLIGLPSAAWADGDTPSQPLLPGTYSNEEQSYFAKELGQPPVPLVMIEVDSQSGMTSVDAFGQPASVSVEGMNVVQDRHGINAILKDGTKLEFRRARPVTCWSAIAKDTKKPDGSADWFFAQNVKMHDQGGRALIGKDVPDVKPVVIRMRNVVWPPKADGSANTNRPSLVLYVHKPDEPDRAESYVWADPGAARIGINLRWMQASCTVDGAENAAR